MAKRKSADSKTAPKTEPAAISRIEGAVTKTADGTLTVTERGLGAIEAAAMAGASMPGIAALLGCSAGTLRDIRERQPEVDDAVSRGLAAEEQDLVLMLRKQARDGYAPAAMFLLKTRHGYRETTPVPPSSRPTTNILVLPAPLSDAEWAAIQSGSRVIDATPAPVKQVTHAKSVR